MASVILHQMQNMIPQTIVRSFLNILGFLPQKKGRMKKKKMNDGQTDEQLDG